MALSGFNVMVLAEDAVGACFITYGVIAGDEQQAAMLASGSAQAEGYWSVEVEEVWTPDDLDPADIGEIAEVLGRTDPVYLDEDELAD
ncbi:MAG: hypothetical protein QUV02_10525 [Maricaulis sp.]|jgi:hypothetical protein|uniref:hypothetical protein n=1 Tax=Maricaulis sp. TaxID=1486257 RepID=UPI001AFCF966|nr:hypothetical protein [Maricaulis sp.]MBO6728775.1 hypothetical protein [Maricaulis sp.]MBO6848116.1 hypothetical protein [Maricaulis sp.]MBO6877810.1 hypothetical protein [Maricaulis sp.]MDM7984876.1 hypothetical protein [Maricaulis sp.]